MTPLWGFSRPNSVTYKILACAPRAHLQFPYSLPSTETSQLITSFSRKGTQVANLYQKKRVPLGIHYTVIKTSLLLLDYPCMPPRLGNRITDSTRDRQQPRLWQEVRPCFSISPTSTQSQLLGGPQGFTADFESCPPRSFPIQLRT